MEKQIIHIYDKRDAINGNAYLKLTNSEINFLTWLDSMGYLNTNVIYESIEELPTPIEF